MTRPYLEKTGDNVTAYYGGSGGPVGLDKEYKIFKGWHDSYQSLYRMRAEPEDYKELGTAMLGWLKEKGLWGQVKEGLHGNGILEFRVLPDELRWTEDKDVQERYRRTRLFLDLPWEILAEDNTFLAAASGNPFCPVRRIGRKSNNLPEPAPYKLSLAFMAASPRDVSPLLNFEQEEASILNATKDASLELLVEESGNLKQLARCLGDCCRDLPDGHKGVDALHLSCHGLADMVNEPLLVLENEFGQEHKVTAGEFLSEIGAHKPGFLFLSACQTAKSNKNNKVSDSLALSCVKAGLPAVLGWGESVGDHDASRFAAELYGALSAENLELEKSVAKARYQLLEPGKGIDPARDWHLARLYLGPDGGGALANGRKARHKFSRTHGVKEFLDPTGQRVPVASRFEFVGRRRNIQDILTEFNEPNKAGVFVHGTGRQGKSSLAARVSSRMPRHKVVVIYGPKEEGGDQSAYYKADMILEAVAKTKIKGVYNVVKQYRNEISENPERLSEALTEILDVCEDENKALLLVVDDFEQALQKPENGASNIHTIKEHCATGIAALIEAFDDHSGESRLLFTSRYKFSLPHRGGDIADRLMHLNLRPMKEEESRKQASAKKLSSGDKLEDALELRIIQAVKGNAGLQDRLFRLGVKDKQACVTALEQLEAYLSEGQDPDQEDVREHLDDIFAKATFELLNEEERDILSASTLFKVPLGESCFRELARKLRIVPEDENPARYFYRLTAFGLWDTLPDFFDEQNPSFLVAPLAAPRALQSPAEAKAVLGTVLPTIFEYWGGKDGSKRPSIFDEELFRLGLLGENAAVLNGCGADALRSLKNKMHYGALAELALKCVDIVRAEMTPDPRLLYTAAEVCQSGGETQKAKEMASEAVKAYEEQDNRDDDSQFQLAAARLRLADLHTQSGEPDQALKQYGYAEKELGKLKKERERVIALGYTARIYVDKGKVDDALKLFNEKLDVAEKLGDTRERAVTLGDIARIYVDKGKVDDALKLFNEKLDVAEKLGDTRERAVTLGDIARIYRSKGKVDEALKIHMEQMEIYEKLGDARERAITLGDIARIYVDKGKVDDALKLHMEEMEIYEKLGDTKSRAVTLGDIARIYVDKGKVDEALNMLNEKLEVAEKLGDTKSRAVTLGDIARIYVDKGKVDDALKLFNEKLDVAEKLGDTKSRAVTLGDIARIYVDKGKVDDALKLHMEMKDIFEKLGDTRERAVTLGDIARIYVDKGKVDDALKLFNEKLDVAEKLGDTKSRAVTLGDIARIYVDKGKVDDALKLHMEMKDIFEKLGDTKSRAVTLGDIARIYVDKGKVDDALKLFNEKLDVAEKLGDTKSRAVTLGDIARIYRSKGKVDEALKIHMEQMEIYEKLGDARERAITLGDIARIYVDKGKVDDALKLFNEKLDVAEKLGDTRERAVTCYDMAQIFLAREDEEQALPLLKTSFELLTYIGYLDGISAVGNLYAGILFKNDEHEATLEVLERMIEAFNELGDTEKAEQYLNAMGKIKAGASADVDQQIELLSKRLEEAEEQNDQDEIASTGFALAQAFLAKEDEEQALPLLKRSFEILLPAQHEDGISAVGELYAGILFKNDEHEAALLVLERMVEAFKELGNTEKAEQYLNAMEKIKAGASGDVDQQIELLGKRLEEAEEQNDQDEIASTGFALAQAFLAKEDEEQALPLLKRSFEILLPAQHEDGITAVGQLYFNVLLNTDENEMALQVLEKMVQAFKELGNTEKAEQCVNIMEQIRGEM